MIPGVNPKQMQQMMKKMGMTQDDYEATEVIIKLADKELVFPSPKVSKVNMNGEDNWQITGEYFEREKEVEIEFTEVDVKQVMDQTNCSEDDAIKALEETGDLAEAILSLTND